MKKSKGMMKKTCKVAKSVFRKTQELFEISQINMKIISYKNKIEKKFAKVGYYVYNKQKKFGFNALSKEMENENFKIIFEEIKKLYEKIADLEKEKDESKGCCDKEDYDMEESFKKNRKYSIEMEEDFENNFSD